MNEKSSVHTANLSIKLKIDMDIVKVFHLKISVNQVITALGLALRG